MNRFDLEQQILSCWNVVEDIKMLREMQDLRTLSADELDNALLGLQTLYNMRFELLFEGCFSNMIKEGKVL